MATLGSFAEVSPRPKPSRLSARWVVALSGSDVLAFMISAFLGIEIVDHLHPVKGLSASFISASVIIVLQILLFERLSLYRHTLATSVRDELYYTTAALTIGALPLLILFTILPAFSTSRLIILTSLAISIPLVGGSRAVLHELRTIAESRSPRRIAIAGNAERTRSAAVALNASTGTEILCIEIADLGGDLADYIASSASDITELPWYAKALAWKCDMLLITETLPPSLVPSILQVAAKQHIKIAFAPPRFRVHAFSLALEVDGEQLLIVPAQLRACCPAAQLLRRIFDMIVSGSVLILTGPIIACAALAVVLESPGPAMFRQIRIGLGGKPFHILKLRSMSVDAESTTGATWAVRGDTRVTRVGRFLRRFSIDELPQLINVIRGEMSVVGPRPERPEFVNTFRTSIPRYDERHLVRPGITGWSQVNLRRALAPSDAALKLSYDLFYIEQWSLFLDSYVLVKTVIEFLFHNAA